MRTHQCLQRAVSRATPQLRRLSDPVGNTVGLVGELYVVEPLSSSLSSSYSFLNFPHFVSPIVNTSRNLQSSSFYSPAFLVSPSHFLLFPSSCCLPSHLFIILSTYPPCLAVKHLENSQIGLILNTSIP